MARTALSPAPDPEPEARPPAAVAKALAQRLLFSASPRRSELLEVRPSWPLRPLPVYVGRNAAFEVVASAMAPFLAYADIEPDWIWSPYDDSLGWAGADRPCALALVWLEFERYGDGDAPALAATVAARLRALRAMTPAPILVADWPAEHERARAFNAALGRELERLPGAVIYPRSETAAQLGGRYRDPRLLGGTGQDLGGAAVLAHAQELGLSWFPAVTRPAVKCLAVDLDNTLYEGVLGEDGFAGVRLTPDHRALQSRLRALAEAGVLLAAVSKNEPQDVEALFAARADFPLSGDSFSAWAVGWGPKADGLRGAAEALNIGLESLLLLDDNLGEIAAVGSELPEVACLHTPDPADALRALELAPGLRRLSVTPEDALRAADLAARARRTRPAEDPRAYLTALHTRLGFAPANASSLGRLQALSVKTNQFNLALARLTPAQAHDYLGPERAAWGVSLADDLSDSGVVAAMFVRFEGEHAVVEDLCISCRALGRGLEDAMILGGLADATGFRPVARVGFDWTEGPRNGPARTWLEAYAQSPLTGAGGRAWTTWDRTAALERLGGSGLDLRWSEIGDAHD